MLRFLSQTETPPGWLRQWTLATGDPPLLLRTFRGSPVCSYEASWRFLSFLCLSFSEINLGNTFYSFSFRQTLKHMVCGWGLCWEPMLGIPDVLEMVEMEAEVGGSFPPKRTVKQILGPCLVPVFCCSSHHCSELLVPISPALPSHYAQHSFSLFHFTEWVKLTLSRLWT